MAAKKKSIRHRNRSKATTGRTKKRKKKATSRRAKPKRTSEQEGDRILAERLYSVREKQGVTRVVVAAETGIPYESLTGYELGDQRAPFSRIRLLAIYYGVSLDYFAGRTDRLVARRSR